MRVGPRDGRADPPRDRLAGPPHGGALRRAARAGHEELDARARRAWCSIRTSRHQDRLAARQRRRAARARAERRRAGLRHDRRVADLQAHGRRCTRPTSRNASRTLLFDIARGALGRRAARAARRAARALLPRGRASAGAIGDDASSTRFRPRRCRSRGMAGDQQAALFGQALLRAGTGQEHLRHRLRSCCINTGDEAAAPRTACSTTVAWRLGERTDLRARGQRLRRRRGGAVAARRARAHRRGGRDGGARRLAGRQRRRVLRPRLHRARRAALGPVRARHDRRADARQRRARTSCAPTLESIAYQTATPCADRGGVAASSSGSCASTAARRPTTC